MIKKALFIVPHPDDELNVGGTFLFDLVQNKIDVYVIFTTNGDSNKEIGNKRVYQAYESLKILGVNENNVIFLGYPDGWSNIKHIYNCSDNEVLTSKTGKNKTNCFKPYEEFCFKTHKIHRSFTRFNFKNDMRDAILSIKADIICCVDFDSHPDHRCASLLFDEIVGELLKENKCYRPIVLKKFAYDGVWTGKKDYYSNPRIATEHQKVYYYSNNFHELAAPCFSWNERIRFATSLQSKTYFLCKNPLFKAALKHKSTNAFFCLLGMINDDIVFWWRPVNNMMMEANINVSSGNSKFLNDFKLFDSDDITNVDDPFFEESYGCWIPDEADKLPTIFINFDQCRVIKEIDIYETCDRDNHIKKIRIRANDKTIFSGELEPSGLSKKIILQDEVKSDSVTIIVEKYQGKPMISEIEMYSEIQQFNWDEIPIGRYQEQTAHRQRVNDKWFIYAIYIMYWKFPEKIRKLVSILKMKLQRV